MRRDITLLTPTYRRDYERFALLRESIERCGIDLPHVAVVQHEDMAQFRALPFKRNLTLLSTREVLPRRLERCRRAWGYRRRNWRRWFGWRPLHGWMSQQLIKLSAPAFVGSEAVLCLDSDFVFVRRARSEDFFAQDGRLHLFEAADGVDVEMAEYLGRSMRFLGVAPVRHPVLRYTLAPAPMHVGVLRDLQSFICERHGMAWYDAIIGTDCITEFATYGVYAKHIDQCARVVPVVPRVVAWFWWSEEINGLEERLEASIMEPQIKLVGVQSNGGRAPASYRGLFEKVWARLESASA